MGGLTAEEARKAVLVIKERLREKVFQEYDELIKESVEYAIGRIESEIGSSVRRGMFTAQHSLNTWGFKDEVGEVITDKEYDELVSAIAEEVWKHFDRLGYVVEYEHSGNTYSYLTFHISFGKEEI